ncbi:hypothetical protein LTR27_003495 [Elasticomyces elasticus]|nr:hypothetical protein LTR27_003495 [Elasticomyces elasticus]
MVRTMLKLLALCALSLDLVRAFVDYGNVYPRAYTLGSNLSIDDASPYGKASITLSSSQPFLTLDYGTEQAGFPFFVVSSLSGPTQIEVKYSEEFPALAGDQSDGPWTFTIGLANTFRVETFNLTDVGRTESFFLQGGQRWESIRLLTDTTVTFEAVGFNSTASRIAPDRVPAHISTSNAIYNDIWDLGARVVQVACVDAGNAPSTWEITEDGALVRGQGTSQSAKGALFSNYTLSFASKITRGGTGWRVASSQNPQGAYFVLTSNYPVGKTFVNTNRTLLPANSIAFTYGTSLLSQETVTTTAVQYYPVNITIEEDTWYNISTAIIPAAYVVSINGLMVASVSIADLPTIGSYFSISDPYTGSFGIGPFQDQVAYFKDVNVVSQNGTLLYQNNLTSRDVLAEYAQAPLDTSVCLDGAKRDRLVWIGDFYHTVKVLAASTQRWDYIIGSIESIFAGQLTDSPFEGLVPIDPYLGGSPEFNRIQNTFAGLLDYQDLFLAGIGEFFHYSGNTSALQPYWTQIKALTQARLAFIDPYSGLIGATPEFADIGVFNFLGPVNGSAVTALNAYALQGLVSLAKALGDHGTAQLYSATAANLTRAINEQLWNDTLGTYSLSLDSPSNYSLTAIAWTILSGAANSSQAASSIAKLDELRCGVGYKTGSGDVCSDNYEISPNTNGFLLDALFKAHRDLDVRNLTVARVELDDFWSVMFTQNEYYSGASWEYTHPDGSPGIERFTSLAHPWGAAPTYVLPEYVLGVAATSSGYATWTFTPLLGGLGLTEANGTVGTPYGDIKASWKIEGDSVEITATVPRGTEASLVLPKGCSTRYRGRVHRSGSLRLRGGEQAHVRVYGWPTEPI